METHDWKSFERLVAAINATKMRGADVRWNDKINGRQFDVSIRFKFGDYEYLTVIECKNYGSKVAVEKVEAFITKSGDVKANKAVMVSSLGFQEGAITVAKQHGIDLITLNEKVEYPEEKLTSIVIPAVNIYGVSLLRKGKRQPIEFEGGSKLRYSLSHTFVIQESKKAALDSILSDWVNKNYEKLSYAESMHEIAFPEGSIVEVSENGIQNRIRAIAFKARFIDTTPSKGPMLDPHLHERMNTYVVMDNILNGTTEKIKLTDIEHGFDTKVKEGYFYVSPQSGQTYFCEKIEGDLVTWWLVESYQHGQRIDIRFTQELEYSKYYKEILDEKIIKRLRKSINELLKGS